MIEMVSASRLAASDFRTQAMLGQSIDRLTYNPSIRWLIYPSNETGLPKLYNKSIDNNNENEILVFVHDDVWIDDYFFGQRIIEGLRNFDVIGVAGNRRRVPQQQCWFSVTMGASRTFDFPNLSGILHQVGNGASEFSAFGPVPAACELLDGVLLAARKSTLRDAGVRFDERFDFHFYDLDFCRTARAAGLRLGTWPLAVTHHSASVFGTPSWQRQKALYFDKWGD